MTGAGSRRLSEAEYAELVSRVQAAVVAALPPGASVLVVSKGDGALLEMPGLRAAHFPQDRGGGYAGHHPRDGAAATAELEALRRRGAEYLVIPATARWWLDHYAELAAHLAGHAELLLDEPGSCLVYGLGAAIASAAQPAAPPRPSATPEQVRDYLECLVSADARFAVLEGAGGIAAALAPLDAVRVGLGELGEGGEGGDSLAAALSGLASEGLRYLVVPRAADEWLDRRGGLGAAIEAGCRKLADQRHLCRVFELDGSREEA